MKQAIKHYIRACWVYPNYECYYSQSKTNYELAKYYEEKWYPDLFEKSIKSSLENLDLALEIAENEEQKINIENLTKDINEYLELIENNKKIEQNNKLEESKTETKQEIIEEDEKAKKIAKQEDINKKADKFLLALEKIANDYSEEEKLNFYKKINVILETLKEKVKNEDKKAIIEALILKLADK